MRLAWPLPALRRGASSGTRVKQHTCELCEASAPTLRRVAEADYRSSSGPCWPIGDPSSRTPYCRVKVFRSSCAEVMIVIVPPRMQSREGHPSRPEHIAAEEASAAHASSSCTETKLT